MKSIIIPTLMASAMASACKTGARTNLSPDDPISISIKAYGTEQSAIDTYKLSAQLSQCSEASGLKTSDGSYKFVVQNVKKDSVCKFRFVGAKSAVAGVNFFSSEEGVFYEAKEVVIKEDTSGGLIGEAYVQTMFSPAVTAQPGTSTWQVLAPVKAPSALKDVCTCMIECSPELPNSAALLTKGATPTDGTCSYTNVAKADLPSSMCSKLTMQCGNTFFVGSWQAPVKVDGGANKATTLPVIDLLPGIPTPEGDVTIHVEVINKPHGG